MRLTAGWVLAVGVAILTSNCSVGPKYVKPDAPVPPAYKEPAPAASPGASQWKTGEPKDDAHRGKWWEVFQDSQLNALEEQVSPTNQTLAAAEAQFRASRAAVRIARSALYPNVTAGAVVTGSQVSGTRATTRQIATPPSADLQILFNVSYEVDLWGRIRHTIAASARSAQAGAADLESVRLSLQTDLALDYFQLRGLDAQKKLLDSTVSAYQKALELTTNRYNQGVASRSDVVQAQTQLETTRAQATDTEVLRAQFEHAIAILTGRPPYELSISSAALTLSPPSIPPGLPSELLERRPDVATAERQMAAANEQIGIAKAAYYPTVTLGFAGGIESSNLIDLFNWTSRFWTLGPAVVQTIFDAGKRRASTAQAQAVYDATVAAYRETVLSAFQEVEDSLSAMRVLDQEAREQAEAVSYAERSLALANNRYQGGITTYLEVITAQSAALANERTAVEILTRRLAASVLLIKALGGGWDVSSLPTEQQVAGK